MDVHSDSNSINSKSVGPARKRLRNWVFTVQLDLVGAIDTSDVCGGDGGGRTWDPNCLGLDESDCRYVICGLEECPDTKRLHWQGYLETTRACDFKSIKKILDCTWVHLEPRKGTQQQAVDYCKKSDTGILDDDGTKILFEWGTPGANGVRGPSAKNNNYRTVLEMPTYQEALQKLEELEPADYIRFNAAVKRGLMAHFLKPTVFIRPKESFNVPMIPENVFKNFAVVLTGLSGAGKTAYAVAHFSNPFVVSHIDQLKDYNPLVYDGLIFDDMSFAHWPVESCIHIIDMEYDRHVNCRHVTGYIPKGTPRFFTSNRAFMYVFNAKDANEEQCKAIERRVHHVLINKKLF